MRKIKKTKNKGSVGKKNRAKKTTQQLSNKGRRNDCERMRSPDTQKERKRKVIERKARQGKEKENCKKGGLRRALQDSESWRKLCS